MAYLRSVEVVLVVLNLHDILEWEVFGDKDTTYHGPLGLPLLRGFRWYFGLASSLQHV